jgi:hypothetical protein
MFIYERSKCYIKPKMASSPVVACLVERLGLHFSVSVSREIQCTKDEATGWNTFYNVEHHNLYSMPNTIRVFKYGNIKLASHIAYMEEIML